VGSVAIATARRNDEAGVEERLAVDPLQVSFDQRRGLAMTASAALDLLNG